MSRSVAESPPARHGLAVRIVVSALFLVFAGPRPSRAETIVWDFATGSGGWVATNTFITSPAPLNPQWTWSATAQTWSVDSVPVQSPAYQWGNYLSSPLINLAPDAPADKFTFTMAHRFNFPANGIVKPGYQLPVDAGQLSYSLDGNVFLPVAQSDWITSGTLPATVAALVQAPGWTVPQFVPGVAPVMSLPPLIDGGASFTGLSPGFSNGWFVASQAFEVDVPATTTTIQFRLTNMNLGQQCGLDAGWDVRLLQVNLILAPEPDGGVIAATGGLLVAAGWIGRGRQRRPRPVTTASRGRA